ncbi:MAG: CAP domain-containing protein, partial [Myxococcota bacterium]|nr:CAP domain-containing protein [Myxococcota bacterium]
LFARMGRTVDLAAAAERLLERINQARQARGAPPLRVHERLREAAQRAADAFFDEPSRSQQDLVDEASGSLRRSGIEFRRVGGLMTVVVDPEEAATLEPALERDMRWIGLGLRQGTRPDTPPNAIAVVMLFGWSR